MDNSHEGQSLARTRRQYLGLLSVSAIGAAAGCSEEGDEDEDGGDGETENESEDTDAVDGSDGDVNDGDDGGGEDGEDDDKKKPEPPTFELTVSPLPAVTVGNDTNVDIAIKNTGEREATQTVTVTVNGDTVTEESVTLAPGERTSISPLITAPFTADDYDVTVTTDTDENTVTLMVEEQSYSESDELLFMADLGDRETPYFDAGHQTISDSGAVVTEPVYFGGGMHAFIYEHDGDRNFIVEAYDDSTDENTALIVNKIGSVTGTTALPAEPGDYYFDVDADGNWSITIAQPLALKEDIRLPPAGASGEGPAVVGPIKLDGGVTASGSHTGERNFIVEVYDEAAMPGFNDSELVFNEIGEFEGETVVQYEGIVWIDVEADGEWTLEFED